MTVDTKQREKVITDVNNKLGELNDSHKKRKDSLETRTVLLKFLLEFKISGVVAQTINQSSKKW